MSDDDDILSGTLVHVLQHHKEEQDEAQRAAELAETARTAADDARIALAAMAEESVRIVGARLLGLEVDERGVKITDDREETAWEILSRIGVPRLRATPVAPSIAASTRAPAPDSPGWEKEDEDDLNDGSMDTDPSSINAQIDAFLSGAIAAQRLKGDGGPQDNER